MSERLWFQASIEGLFLRGVGGRMTPALREKLRGVGIDLEKLAPAYLAEHVTQAIQYTLDELYPQHSREEALRELGRVFLRGYGQTLIGRAMVQFMRVIGPRRTLERMQRNFRTGSNFIETTFTAIDEHTASLWFSDVSGMPEFYAGIMEEGGRATGVQHISIAMTPGPGSGYTYRVSWS